VEIHKTSQQLNSHNYIKCLSKICVYREAWEQNPAEPSVTECVRGGGISELHVTWMFSVWGLCQVRFRFNNSGRRVCVSH